MVGADDDNWNANRVTNRTQDRWNLIRDIEISPSLEILSLTCIPGCITSTVRLCETGKLVQTISGVLGSDLIGDLSEHFMGEKINKQVAIQILNGRG